MENHPIPQDITGFQFKLIGEMTIKQFAYLAAGIILGWIAFSLPVFFLIKIPVAILFVFSGIATAFFPIAGRPFDTMVKNFLKALFAPTQYVYQKTGGHIWFPQTQNIKSQKIDQVGRQPTARDERLREYLSSIASRPKNKFDQKEMAFFESLSSIMTPSSIPSIKQQQVTPQAGPKIISATPVPLVQSAQNKQTTETKNVKEEQTQEGILSLKHKLDEAKMQEKIGIGTAKYAAAHQKVIELEKLLQDVVSQKQALEGQIQTLQKNLNMQNQNFFTPSLAQPKRETQNVRKIPKLMTKSIGIPIVPDIPNLIAGIIKDPRDNPIPNILVEVKDNSDNPVRAFKTNALGQFASATPLVNGTYTISFEDPTGQNKFDNIEITAIGETILPLEVISFDTREELRRSLFNQ